MRSSLSYHFLLSLAGISLVITILRFAPASAEEPSHGDIRRSERLLLKSANGEGLIDIGFSDDRPYIRLTSKGTQRAQIELEEDNVVRVILGPKRELVLAQSPKIGAWVMVRSDSRQVALSAGEDRAMCDVRGEQGLLRLEAGDHVALSFMDPPTQTLKGEQTTVQASAVTSLSQAGRVFTLRTPSGQQVFPMPPLEGDGLQITGDK